jgi:DNA/RNA-binding domain of Phe-tRNA-synthetase-like protein
MAASCSQILEDSTMPANVVLDSNVTDLALGLIEASGITIAAADAALTDECQNVVRHVLEHGSEGGENRRQAVRQLLRSGGFKPSGRNKPAQEYLLRTAKQEGQWPAILNAVDVLNAVSLQSGLPISLVALSRAGSALLIRYGNPGESFVFNQSGQVLDVHGLICICRDDGERTVPVGSPVKDSQMAKVTAADRNVLACLFAPRSVVTPASLHHWCSKLADGLKRWCCADNVEAWVVPESW